METCLRHFNQSLSHLMRTVNSLRVAVQEPKRIPLIARAQIIAFDLSTHQVYGGAASRFRILIASPEVQWFITCRDLGSDITLGKDRGELDLPRNRTPDPLIVGLSLK